MRTRLGPLRAGRGLCLRARVVADGLDEHVHVEVGDGRVLAWALGVNVCRRHAELVFQADDVHRPVDRALRNGFEDLVARKADADSAHGGGPTRPRTAGLRKHALKP